MHELPTLKPHHNVPAHPASHHHHAHLAAHHLPVHHLPVHHHAAPVHHVPVHHQPVPVHHPAVIEEVPASTSGSSYPPVQPSTYFGRLTHPSAVAHPVAHPVLHSAGIHQVHIPPVHLPNGGAFTAFADLGGKLVDNGSKSERLVVAQTPSFSSTFSTATTTPPTTSPDTTVAPSAPEAPEASPISEESGKMEKLVEMAMERLKMMQHMDEE